MLKGLWGGGRGRTRSGEEKEGVKRRGKINTDTEKQGRAWVGGGGGGGQGGEPKVQDERQ